MNKKGTHVEVIISFIIFITFVIFIFAASRPSITKQEDKKNLFESLENEITEDVSTNMEAVTINLGAVAGNCVTLDKTLGDLGIGDRIIVRNSSGKVVASNINVNSLTINRGNPTDTFFKIYYSEVFDQTPAGGACALSSPTIGLTKTNQYISQKKVLTLITRINQDYETVKAEYRVAKDMEFAYGLVLFNGTVIETTNEELVSNISTSVYVKDTPVEYLDLNGEIRAGNLRTKIW